MVGQADHAEAHRDDDSRVITSYSVPDVIGAIIRRSVFLLQMGYAVIWK